MEKELKIAELATIWGVSVPTTWNRIKKMGLITFIKKNENNKDINYVTISDEQINEFIINVNNNINKGVNNGFYEDILSDDNVNNNHNKVVDAEIIRNDATSTNELLTVLNDVYNGWNERIININNQYNEEVKTLYEEIANCKANKLFLEDKASREGLYINEINELKADNKRQKQFIYTLVIIIGILLLGLTGYITYNIAVNNLNKPVNNEVINVSESAQVQAPAVNLPAKPVQARKK